MPIHWKILIFGAFTGAGLPGASSTFAQFQQPLVFSSGGVVAVRNDQTGALTAVSGSPFASVQSQFTLDVQGRFPLTATVKAGQTAQYNLQLAAGAGFTGTVSLACSGAPLAATCAVPATVQVSSGTATAFTVAVATTGSGVVPIEFRPRPTPPLAWRLIFVIVASVILFFAFRSMKLAVHPRRARFKPACGVACELLLLVFCASGCGGRGSLAGQVVPPPPPVVTPAGTFTITITPSSTSSSGKPLQLQPIQLTLTVN